MRNLVVKSHVTKELSHFIIDEFIDYNLLPAKITTDFDCKGHLPDDLFLWKCDSPCRLDSKSMTIKPLHNLRLFFGNSRQDEDAENVMSDSEDVIPDHEDVIPESENVMPDPEDVKPDSEDNQCRPIGLEFDGTELFCADQNGNILVVTQKASETNPMPNFWTLAPLQCIKLDPQYEIVALITESGKLQITHFNDVFEGQIAEVYN